VNDGCFSFSRFAACVVDIVNSCSIFGGFIVRGEFNDGISGEIGIYK
jgi:hypothetical protein